MAAIVNSRDLILQAANPRVITVSLPSNVTVPQEQVDGLPAIVLNSKVIFLRATSQVFQIPKTGSVAPASITLTPIIRNVSGTLTWNVISGTATLDDGTGADVGKKILQYANMSTDVVTVKLTITDNGVDYTDTITIAKLREGADTINAILSNESHTLSANSSGVVTSYSGAGTSLSIFIGTTDTTNSWTFTKTDGLGVTSSISGNTVTITDFQAAYDTSYVDITAKRTGYADINRRFSVTKSKAGTNGTNGTNGSNGSDGTRGSVTAYAYGSSWSDSTANSAIQSASGTWYKVIGDTVTISNNSSFAKTRYWSGGAWVDPGVVIDGNLLVSGTLSATKIYGGTLGGVTINIGNGAFEVSSTGVVTADNLFAGIVRADNAGFTAYPALTAYAQSGTSDTAFASHSGSSNAASHAIRGKSNTFGTSGLVGMAGAFDFYAEGSGTNYGPFTGAHDALILPEWLETLKPGMIMIDRKLVARKGWSNTIFEVEPSTKAHQQASVGVLVVVQGPLLGRTPAALVECDVDVVRDVVVDIDPETGKKKKKLHFSTDKQMCSKYQEVCDKYTLVAVNALGEGQVLVCGENGNLRAGDLIVTSSTLGVGMKQKDDIVRTITVAKVREDVEFSSRDEVKPAACIYLCG